MIDGDPVQSRAEIPFGSGHQIPGEGTQIFEIARVLRRDDEPEMMPVVFAARRKSAPVEIIAFRPEQVGVSSILADAVALQVAEMLGHGRGAKTLALVAHDAGLRDDASGRAGQTFGGSGKPSASKRGVAGARAARADAIAGISGFPRSSHDLVDETCGLLRGPAAVADTPGADAQVIVAPGHGCTRFHEQLPLEKLQ
ncbi:hypothetical protein [Roseivivax sp. THAF40]|uniref:hypothetical protein n=1 Tax=Roseivivax sp. THAF40 TaxID=2587858 RepID=UPI00352B8C12